MHIHNQAFLISFYLDAPELGIEGCEGLAPWDGKQIGCSETLRLCWIIFFFFKKVVFN